MNASSPSRMRPSCSCASATWLDSKLVQPGPTAKRSASATWKVMQISEVTGMEEDVITMQEAFRFVRSGMDSQGRVVGRFTASGVRPRVLDRLDELGLEMPSEIQSLFHESVHQAL